MSTSNVTDFKSFVEMLFTYINYAIPLIIGLSAVVLMWGVFQYFMKADDEKGRAEGSLFIMYGIIALFVMLSVWGLVNVVIKTFGLDKTSAELAPSATSQYKASSTGNSIKFTSGSVKK